MKVQLTRKFADAINGIDLSQRHVGEVFELPNREARLLVAEGWALPARTDATAQPADEAADRPRRRDSAAR